VNIGIFLGIGESLGQMEKTGQKDRFVNFYLKRYIKDFEKVYLFSYANELDNLPKNIILVPNKSFFHRFIYAFLLPIINREKVQDCDVIRGFGLTSSIPSFLLFKPFIINWPYDYLQLLKVEKRYFYIPIFYILEKLAFTRAKKVFIATKKKFRNLKEKKYIYLPNGVDISLFKPTLNHKRGIVYVGRLEEQKNLFFLIDSIAFLPERFRKIAFLGSGSLKTKLQKYALEKKVLLSMHRPISNSNLPKFMANYSIFTLASFAEGSPKALLEAMAVGLVPVVTDFETATDIVTNANNGFIINFNKEEFSVKIKNLLENKNLWLNLSKNASHKISREFNLSKLMDKEIRILKNAN